MVEPISDEKLDKIEAVLIGKTDAIGGARMVFGVGVVRSLIARIRQSEAALAEEARWRAIEDIYRPR